MDNALMEEMQEGQRVEVRLHGDEHHWYTGVVIKARKQWVELEDHPSGGFIADENNIAEWHEARPD